MTEIEFENLYLQHGTAKKKAELLGLTNISPVRMAALVKRFGEPIPSTLQDVDMYAADLFDFMLDTESGIYGQFVEEDLMLDVTRYVAGEVWGVKHKSRSIIDPRCAVALDLRKCLKDAMSGIAQIAGHMLKHSDRAELEGLSKDNLRTMFIEAAEEAQEEVFGKALDQAKLLGQIPEPTPACEGNLSVPPPQPTNGECHEQRI